MRGFTFSGVLQTRFSYKHKTTAYFSLKISKPGKSRPIRLKFSAFVLSTMLFQMQSEKNLQLLPTKQQMYPKKFLGTKF